MKRCVSLALNGLGTTYPNPLVGCVIVYKDTIIGEGWHKKSGGAHAEVNAINSVTDTSLLEHATLYVNLEPCSHFGKTPPCSDLIIKHKIRKVVVGSKDPNPLVSGKGLAKISAAGIEIEAGILENECDELNKRFFTFHKSKRPYIILKWAESADGFISPESRDEINPVWISNTRSRQLVHKWRSEEQAILVGTQTVIDDNPQLTIRDWKGNNPIRIVLDRSRRIPHNSRVFDDSAQTIAISDKSFLSEKENVIFDTADFSEGLPGQIVAILYRREIQSVIIEGGAKTLQSFIDSDLWDEARIFTGMSSLGGGVKAPDLVRNGMLKFIAGDQLNIIRNHD